MRYIRLSDNTVFTIDALRDAHPDTSIPDGADCSALGYSFLTETPRPAPEQWHEVIEGAPVGGLQQWVQQPLSAEAIMQCLTAAVQGHLDDTARARNYDGILSACTYATDSHPPFQLEGQACVNWRGAVWSACYQIMGEVNAGTRAIPSEAELIALLPAMVWP